MTLKRNLCEGIDGDSGFDNLHLAEKCEQVADEYAIEFANWLRMVDIPENAEKWFHYSDKDMLNVFKKERGL